MTDAPTFPYATVRVIDVVRDAPAVNGADKLTDACGAARFILALMSTGTLPIDREFFAGLYLDAQHRPIAAHAVSIGTAELTQAHPREVFRPAIVLAASAVVVVHNHPSGDVTPSPQDAAVTDRLRQAGDLLGIAVLDHIIVGRPETGTVFSMASGERHAL